MARPFAPWIGAIVAAAVGGAAAAAMFGLKPHGAAEPVEVVITDSWGKPAAATDLSMSQDPTQRDCTRYGDRPPDAVAVAIMQREWRTIAFPPDGRSVGDWRRGEALARGGDQPERSVPTCSACHLLDRGDSGQRSGPSLVGYGLRRTWSAQAAALVYEQIYNSNAVVACSPMPRFGAQKLLSPEQIRDIVAYLTAPESPVNRTVVTSAERKLR